MERTDENRNKTSVGGTMSLKTDGAPESAHSGLCLIYLSFSFQKPSRTSSSTKVNTKSEYEPNDSTGILAN
jgi:hypothetical protein